MRRCSILLTGVWFLASTMFVNVHAASLTWFMSQDARTDLALHAGQTDDHGCARIGRDSESLADLDNADSIGASCYASCMGLLAGFLAPDPAINYHVFVDGWSMLPFLPLATIHHTPPVQPPKT